MWTSGSNVHHFQITFQGLLNASTVHSGHLPSDLCGWKSSLLTVFTCTGQWQMVASPMLDWWREARAAQRFISLLFYIKFERGSPLINGSTDAPATSHSGHHNRQTYEAEPGMEYWRNEWKHTHKRPDITPVRSYSLLLIVCLCWRGSAAGVSFFSNYWRSQRLRQDVEKSLSRAFGGLHPNKDLT